MWTRIASISLVIYFATSHPTTEENEPSRVARQLDFGDSCPCPKAKNPGARDQDALGDSTGNYGRFVDDCPCRLREADSQASPSMLFPTSMRAERPFSRPSVLKDDPKNLLQPEVGLANSVLETLRKATSEEYQEALARDAARSTAKSDQDEYTPAEGGRNTVTIILNPKETDSFDDVMPEASHVKEARCIHPGLGSYRSSNLGKMRMPASQPTHLMKDIFRFPKGKSGLLHRNLLDMDSNVGASNVQEHVVMDNNRLKSNRPIFNQNLFNSNTGIKLIDPLTKVRTNGGLDVIKKRFESSNNDFGHIFNNKDGPVLRLSPSENNFFQRPASLRNLLKLKDVELIPSKIPDKQFKFDVPKLRLTPLINHKRTSSDGRTNERKPDLSDLIRNGFKLNLNKHKPIDIDNHEEKINAANSNTNVQLIPRPKDDMMDVITSPSNIDEQVIANQILDKDCDIEETEIDKTATRDIQNNEKIVMKDAEPSPSENHSLFASGDRNKESFSCDDTIDFKNNLESNSDEIIPAEPQVTPTESAPNQISDEVSSEAIGEKQKYEENNNPDKNSNECLEKLNIDQFSTAETNNVPHNALPEEENVTDSTKSSLEQEIVNDTEPTTESLNKNVPSVSLIKSSGMKPMPLNEALTSIKENVLKTLKGLKNTSPNIKPELSKNAKSSILEENNKDETEGYPSDVANEVSSQDPDCKNEEPEMEEAASTQVVNNKNKESMAGSDSVTTRDLQKLSDSILEASTKKEGALASSSEPCDEISEEVENTTENSNEEIQNLLDSETSPTTQNEVTDPDFKTKNADACISALGVTKNGIDREEPVISSSSDTKGKSDEMTVEASNSILDSVIPDPLGIFNGNNNLRSSLLPDIIVQPSFLNDDLNIFKQPQVDLSDIFNLKSSLPTLDDIKLQLSSIFNANERDTSEEISYEVKYDRDRAKSEMATAASTSNLQSKLPNLKRFEDVNLDIFQMKPITSAHSDLISKIPRLNLNSYRTKLAIPKTLELKPIKLQSALGDKAGVLGATLTLIPDEFKVNPLHKSSIENSRVLSDLLGSSLTNIPSLDELHETMRSNVQSLVNTPLIKSPENIYKTSLIPSDFHDNIRNHAENTLKDMQKTMKVLKSRPPSDITNLAGTIMTPDDLVELASRTREDVSDKLKALHYDLNDRLTSIRESTIDVPKLPSLYAPFPNKNRIFNTSPKSNLRSNPSTPRTRSSSPGTRESQLKSFGNRNIGASKAKTFKMSPAASIPVPKSVEVPKLKSTSSKSVLPSVQREPTLRQNLKSGQPTQSMSSILRQPIKSTPNLKKSTLNTPGPFHKDTKVTISFSTTPKPSTPVYSTKKTFDANPKLGSKTATNFPTKLNTNMRSRPNSLDNHNSDRKASPNYLRSSSKAKFATMATDNPYLSKSTTSKPLLGGTKPKTTLFKQLSKDNSHPESTRLKASTIPALSKGSKDPDISSWPNASDNAFLSKVRETMRARLANFKPILSRDLPDSRRSNVDADMARSPSENVETVLDEPLKENVSYKCRMVCTKE